MEHKLESMRLTSPSSDEGDEKVVRDVTAAAAAEEEVSATTTSTTTTTNGAANAAVSGGGGGGGATTTNNNNEIDSSDENQSDDEDEDVFEDATTPPEEENLATSSSSSGGNNNSTSNNDGELYKDDEETDEDVSERMREEDFSELLQYVKVAVEDENPLEKFEKLGSTLWQLSNDALEQLANREEIESQQGGASDGGVRSIFGIVNEEDEEEEDEANVSKDGGLNLQDLPKCVQLAAKELSVFAKALTIDPGMAYRPGSSKTREVLPGETTMRAIGSHRVGAAEIIAMMLQLGCLEIDEKMAHLKLEETNDDSKPMTLETLAIMLFEYPWSSAFHAAASRAILAALSSPHEKLWMPLVVCARDEAA